MKIKKIAKWLCPVLIAILFLWLYAIRYFSPHRWYAKKRVYAMFEALEKGDYETAWKHWDPKQKFSIERFKIFLKNGEIYHVDEFDIVWVEVIEFKKLPPWMTVYVKVNGRHPPEALAVRYNELISYAGFNRYIDI